MNALPAPPWPVHPRLWTEELRNHCGCARPRQAVDFAGTVLGLYFMVEGWSNPVNALLGAAMVWIHAARWLATGPEAMDCAPVCAGG